MMNTFEDQHE